VRRAICGVRYIALSPINREPRLPRCWSVRLARGDHATHDTQVFPRSPFLTATRTFPRGSARPTLRCLPHEPLHAVTTGCSDGLWRLIKPPRERTERFLCAPARRVRATLCRQAVLCEAVLGREDRAKPPHDRAVGGSGHAAAALQVLVLCVPDFVRTGGGYIQCR
jgi:hypothetical protein